MSDRELQPASAKVAAATLEYPLLDYWVARAEGLETPEIDEYGCAYVHHHEPGDDGWWTQYRPTTDWAIGGPIIERELIDLNGGIDWHARSALQPVAGSDRAPCYRMVAGTPLVAAMRAYVASKFGEYVEDAK